MTENVILMSRRKKLSYSLMFYFSAFILISLLFVLSFSNVSASNFVKVNGSEFILKGKPFYFEGANTYYLWYGSYKCGSTPPNKGCTSEVLNDARKMNLSVLRVWGFSDGTGNYWGQLQPDKGVYSEKGFKKFDKMISQAKAKKIKLIIPLVNNWNDFGGMCQYVMWCNSSVVSCSDVSDVHDRFYTGKCERRLYKKYVSHMLNRKNTITGVAYKNDPTIMAWELANEPRAKSDSSQTIVDNWIEEMSTYIKTIDNKHLVSVGMEGWSETYEGTDFLKNHNHTNIDFMAFHLIADNWGFDAARSLNWIDSHMNDAKALGKPIILEEIGKQTGRASYLKQIYAFLEEKEINGDMVWMLKDKDYPNFDGYGIDYPEDTEVVNEITKHANFMKNLSI